MSVREVLSVQALERLVDGIAERPHLWRPLVAHDPARRIFRRVPGPEAATLWLICWMPGHDTGFHDHDGSWGHVRVLDGWVREERLSLGSPTRSRILEPGQAFSFGAGDIHRVVGAGDGPAVTLHAYSPPLAGMGAYSVDPDGVLRRERLAEDVELRPT